MKKRILSLFLALLMVLSFFSVAAVSASAVNYVSAIAITNLRSPLAGNKPDYNSDFNSSAVVKSLSQSLQNIGAKNGIIWYELVKVNPGSNPIEKKMSPSDTFELGKKYRVYIFVMPTGQFEFANSVSAKIYELETDTPGTVAKTAEVTTPTGNTSKQYKAVHADYTCTKSAVDNVQITGLKIPKAGEVPDDDCNVLANGVYVNGKVEWVRKTGNDTYDSFTGNFVAGETYKFTVWLKTEFENGYWFKTDENGENIANVTVNGLPCDICDTALVDYVRGLSCEYYVSSNLISRIDVDGISYPVAGMLPDYDAGLKTTGCDIVSLYWVDETLRDELIAGGMKYVDAAQRAMLENGDGKTFEEGHKYKLIIEVKPQENYEIDYDPGDYDVLYFSAFINGAEASESSGYRGDNAGFSRVFGTPILQLISKIDIYDVDSPVAGNVPDYEATCGANTYTIVGMSWMDVTLREQLISGGATYVEAAKQAKMVKGDGKTFEAGHIYSVGFEVAPCKNYEIDYYPEDWFDILYFNAFVNNGDATEGSGYRHENASFSYTFDHTCEYTYDVTKKATLESSGKADVKCKGCDYTGTVTIYRPKTINLSKTEYTYNGETKKPTVAVKDTKGKELKKDTDYTVSYESGRKSAGRYTVTVKFKGKYSGTKTLDFTIQPRKVADLTATQTITTITLKWAKSTGADGYRVYQYNSDTKEYKKVADVADTTVKIRDLKSGTKYKFKVRAYVKDDGTIYGNYSDVLETATRTKTPEITSVKSTTKGKATVKWSDVSRESKYQLYYATSKSGTYKRYDTYDANDTDATVKNLTSGKTYYFKVRTYKNTDSGKVYSSYSAVKSVKVK